MQKKMIGSFLLNLLDSMKNTGKYAGTEIVQLYIRDCQASIVRPVMELAGFQRITLEPDEEQTVAFCLKASQSAFMDVDYRWKIEAGEIEVMLAASSNDIRLKSSYRIMDSCYIEGKDRAFWANNK